ncbi:hypothetical protein KFK09_014045 [Dendrobium nobile]|uniref:Uncharacterized protein n=1 Tax=Dendrobium nobile TaxID=94219 RepID=A0A8T3B931_DENNO|nr:hypothetical protein KFK09_014045 [Dendrobium nobile]
MAIPTVKSGNICFWFISFLFFLLILAGGAMLILYITLPEMEDSTWLAVAGIVLIAVPWLFWILACLYLTLFPWRKPCVVVPVASADLKLEGAGDIGPS